MKVAFRSEADIFYSPLVPRLCLGTHCTYGSAVDAESKTRSKVNSSRSNCQTVVPKVSPLAPRKKRYLELSFSKKPISSVMALLIDDSLSVWKCLELKHPGTDITEKTTTHFSVSSVPLCFSFPYFLLNTSVTIGECFRNGGNRGAWDCFDVQVKSLGVALLPT